MNITNILPALIQSFSSIRDNETILAQIDCVENVIKYNKNNDIACYVDGRSVFSTGGTSKNEMNVLYIEPSTHEVCAIQYNKYATNVAVYVGNVMEVHSSSFYSMQDNNVYSNFFNNIKTTKLSKNRKFPTFNWFFDKLKIEDVISTITKNNSPSSNL